MAYLPLLQTRGYLAEFNNGLDYALSFLDSDDYKNKTGGWKQENEDRESGDKIYSIQSPTHGKVFTAEATLVLPGYTLQDVFDDVFHKIDDMPKWNTDCIEYRKLFDVGKQTDCTYAAMPDILKGIVKSRDVVDVRGWRQTGNDRFDIASRSVDVPTQPPVKSRVRAVKHFEHVILKKAAEPDTFTWTWCHRFDMKGMLPKSIVDQTTHYMMLGFFKQFRAHLKAAKP